MSFKNLSIILKIVSLLILLGALASFSAVYSGMKMHTIDAVYNTLLDHDSRAVQSLSRANRSLSEVTIGILEDIISTTEEGNNKALAHQKSALDSAKRFFGEAMAFAPERAEDIRAIQERALTAYNQTCAETLRLTNNVDDINANAKALKLLNDTCAPALKGVTQSIFDYVEAMTAQIKKSSSELSETTNTTVMINYALIFGGLVIVMLLSVFVAVTGISGPIKRLAQLMNEISGGNLSLTVFGTDRSDEIGMMSRNVEQFRLGMVEAERARESAMQTDAQNTEAMKRARNQIADQFQAKMGALADAFAKSAGEVSDAAKNLSATAEETSRQAQAVSGAAEEASANVQTVAASTEEMTASIREIASQVSKSSSVANTAASEASSTENDVRALSEAAAKIGEVVELINNIAGQTNLLALNATIEAARAGEAGRGFAVVASEVKQLAAQTARATEEISAKINEIQSATNRTVGSIDKIVGTVSQIQQISTMIATAIEEQGAATGEIASNTQRAARGTEDVTNNINGVGRAAEMTGSASTQLMGLSSNLNDQAGDLQREVGDFVRQLRAG